MIPADMLREAGIGDQCAFVGRGDSFQIWQPDALERRKTEARTLARSRRADSAHSAKKGGDDE